MIDKPALSYGLFHAQGKPNKLYGLVTTGFKFQGLNMDIGHLRHIRWVKDDNPQSAVNNKPELTQNGKSAAQNRWIDYNKMRGQHNSAMEHATPEQFWVDKTQCRYTDGQGQVQNPAQQACAEGISAVKAIAIAQVEGQRIYTINQGNRATALASLPVGGTVGSEIRNAIQSGKEVTFHESPINAHGWTGYGYTITDPDTGAGGYLIEGSGNGGWMDLVDWIKDNPGWAAIASLVLVGVGGLISGILGSLLVLASIVISAISLYYDLLDIMDAPCGGPAMAGLFGGLIVAAFIVGLFFGGIGVAIALTVLGYLLPELHTGLMNSLRGNNILCP